MTPEWSNIILAAVVAVVGIVGRLAAYYDRRWRDHIEHELAEHEKRFDRAGQHMSDLTDTVQQMPDKVASMLRQYQRIDLCETRHVDVGRRVEALEQLRDRLANESRRKGERP